MKSCSSEGNFHFTVYKKSAGMSQVNKTGCWLPPCQDLPGTSLSRQNEQQQQCPANRINCLCRKIAVSCSKSVSMTLPDPVQTIWCSLLFVQAQTVDHTLCIKKKGTNIVVILNDSVSTPCCNTSRNDTTQKVWPHYIHIFAVTVFPVTHSFIHWNGLCDSTAPTHCS